MYYQVIGELEFPLADSLVDSDTQGPGWEVSCPLVGKRLRCERNCYSRPGRVFFTNVCVRSSYRRGRGWWEAARCHGRWCCCCCCSRRTRSVCCGRSPCGGCWRPPAPLPARCVPFPLPPPEGPTRRVDTNSREMLAETTLTVGVRGERERGGGVGSNANGQPQSHTVKPHTV